MRRLAALFLLCCSAPLAAQSAATSLSIYRNGALAGLERYTVSTGPDGGASVTITSVATYPAAQPTEQYQATLEQDGDDRPSTFILMGGDSSGPVKAMAGVGRGRVTIKASNGRTETGRELPARPNTVLLDDRLFAFFIPVAGLATADGVTLTGIYPRTGRVITFTARVSAGPSGQPRTVTLTGDITGTITLDGAGQLTRIDLPSEHVSASRVPS